MKKIQEGKVIFKANLSGKDKGPGKIKGVFYNPSMKLSRDLHVEFAKQFDFRGILLDGMAASGIRGMRLMLESNIRVEFCEVHLMWSFFSIMYAWIDLLFQSNPTSFFMI